MAALLLPILSTQAQPKNFIYQLGLTRANSTARGCSTYNGINLEASGLMTAKQGFCGSFLLIVSVLLSACRWQELPPIKVGILHSLTGTMAISEKSVVDATLMAIEEVNAAGGVLGRRLQAVVVDGKSDWPSFATGARQLIQDDNVKVIFGCWTSASRKEVKVVVEALDHLLFYPVQYEGLEASANIIYTGSTPNQQIFPAVKWSVENFGKRVFLAASDYVFPRAANKLIKKQLQALGAQVVGEAYVLLGSDRLNAMTDAIAKSNADVILNTINGDSNITFFNQLAAKKNKIPVMSFSLAEGELQHLDVKTVTGHYAAWSYFQSLNSKANIKFVRSIKKKYGEHRTTNASMEAGYIGVHLWAKAANQSKSVEPTTVKTTLRGQVFNAPEGRVIISASNNHLWKPFYIGKIQDDGQFEIVWRDKQLLKPQPFPMYESKDYWRYYLNNLYLNWQGNWAPLGHYVPVTKLQYAKNAWSKSNNSGALH